MPRCVDERSTNHRRDRGDGIVNRSAPKKISLLIIFFLLGWMTYEASLRQQIPFEPLEEQREAVTDDVFGDRAGEWPRVRAEFVRLHPVCEACGSRSTLNVHHVRPFHLYPNLELDPDNLITLCRENHFKVGHDPDGPWKPKRPSWSYWNPNVREHASIMRKGKR